MNDTLCRTPVTPPSSTASIPNDSQVDDPKDVNREALREATSQIVHDLLSDRDLEQYDLSTAELIVKYNCRPIPIMPDETFVAKINHFRESGNSEEKVESEVQRFMDQENARVYKAYEDTKLEHGVNLICLFTDTDEQHCLMNSIRTVTLHGYQAFVAICTPMLLETSRQLQHKLEGMPKEISEAGAKKSSRARPKGSSKAVRKWSSNRVLKTGSKVSRGASKPKRTSLDQSKSTWSRDARPDRSQKHSYNLRPRSLLHNGH
jgi:hypothetical protein